MEVNGAPKQPGYKLYSEYLHLCSEQINSYRFGTTWGWVNDDSIFIFGWTIPLKVHIIKWYIVVSLDSMLSQWQLLYLLFFWEWCLSSLCPAHWVSESARSHVPLTALLFSPDVWSGVFYDTGSIRNAECARGCTDVMYWISDQLCGASEDESTASIVTPDIWEAQGCSLLLLTSQLHAWFL